MPPILIAALVIFFVAVAVATGLLVSLAMTRSTPSRRLSELLEPRVPSVFAAEGTGELMESEDPAWDPLLRKLPTSLGTVKRLKQQLTLAGFYTPKAAALFSLSELVFPIVLGGLPLLLMGDSRRWIAAAFGGVIGYFLPGLLLARRLAARKKDIENGLADALDLLVLCLEAGSSLDQAIVKTSEELEVAYPALGDQLRVMTSEMRAGKGRIEAFRALADRTRVDDVRALVAMLVQTDRFGTSIAQALRTHSEVCRTKRRQRAEERAEKVGVKLVFPLVFCLFPALYVVMLGPAFIQFLRVFAQNGPQ